MENGGTPTHHNITFSTLHIKSKENKNNEVKHGTFYWKGLLTVIYK